MLRARSDAEKYSKLSIVVEEVDETLFWLEIIHDCEFSSSELLQVLTAEAKELVKVMASYRARLKK